MSAPTLHLVRRGATPAGVAAGDWVIALEERVLADRGNPPVAPGPITDDQLVQLLFAARRVITW